MKKFNEMSMRELARKIGVSVAYLSDVFKGNRTLNEDRYNQIVELVPELKDKFKIMSKKITYVYKVEE